ncbi:hypothetical protein N7448_004297 [Penicillium atrosanguineum]|uniref:SMODS and SLOG-associating 2TM effector domain-containing protein n=1 Tax=Penicillium atrosanguineum TaxID=1132637 RepID=A0A9W9H911_9EURO|nr:uncharacterized protein N7443_003262 [Penicillium atrosanguineum]KAJ5140889.1 hypothetical protein N7448_004297 [Penicillium atrosanguineum]KAJ5310801.1 hypothetical protein N7443_003262 [Penicillium atrosanguineum]KAJ5316325.1 hypothetical protein N7476_006632 [Penicillium atrosanguineum]
MPEGSHDRSLLRRVIEAALFREDNHYPPMAAHAAAAAERNGIPDLEAAKRFTLPVNDPDHLIPPNDKLLIFRALTGIDSVPALTSGGHLLRTAPNVGIYTRVVNNETKSARAFRLFNWMINICLGIQIIVAAAVTAVGAASGPHSAVTAFGAINTIMAGILTYLRGSGLPDRLKAYQNKWKNIREYIEQREREFCLVGCDLDVQEEVFIVESMYQSVKSEMETTKSTGDARSQQPDDPRIRRSLLPSSHQLSGQRAAMTPSKRADVVCSHPSHDDEPVSPVTIPEKTAEKV